MILVLDKVKIKDSDSWSLGSSLTETRSSQIGMVTINTDVQITYYRIWQFRDIFH